mmetsp:Transcript_43869/g.105841  ORF Transcript_43869/g.105841 Transcript_43869/m.105841 type:complete len:3072 (+) Transcript_43869:108-9323(+)|eukprot:CAMPEP_0113655036 /NCGR_PEP_ID=MMETSP0017_2-20120614/29477_1 /TAXON_ID=2856 /ORGANISM="Cylindrotheca closterium" /LENGTH=3071 /DNA_ID=CAMNT_0000568227 /DNA_START=6 /DNA_END=9221 /DNA_ORIENTATION=+ /assembly_acc=CAM_ASM_000147
MTAGTPNPPEAQPPVWDGAQQVPPTSLKLWKEVGEGLDKSQTVVWKSAVESLGQAKDYFRTSNEARDFVERYMTPIIGILVEQQPTKIGAHERNCVQESLALAVSIVSIDLEIQIQQKGECKLMDTLSLVFNKKKAYYKGNKANWNVSHLSGLPEVRLKMIERFRHEQGFTRFCQYMSERLNTALFPNLSFIHQILTAVLDALPNRAPGQDPALHSEMEDAAIEIAKPVMDFIDGHNDSELKKLSSDQLNNVLHDLQRIFDKLIISRREASYKFYAFWRGVAMKLIKTESLPLRLAGWQQIEDILEASADHRPPPRGFQATDAGCTFVNGKYLFKGPTTPDGYAYQGMDIKYERSIPREEPDGGGKKLTLFRCTMRSQQKWWFLSEADEEQPGTDRDIDYYQHKSKQHEEKQPPQRGWITCRNAGVDPPPQLQAAGLMVPSGEEFTTLEHQLAQWAIENGIIELVLGDSVHREIVARSTSLLKFLASMCERDSGVESTGTRQPNMYCLQQSHLLLAWKTCTRKADAAVATQVFQLLVSILPSCPSSLAIPLLKAVQESLFDNKEKRDYLAEVAEFCSALAAANSADTKSASLISLADDVRAEVLELLWSVLTHPEASQLKSYDSLKQYVTNELRVEPKGKEHREKYLRICVQTLASNAGIVERGSVDETQALRMVRLTHFVLEACPRAQAATFVMEKDGTLPKLLFGELIAFMKRRDAKVPQSPRKSPLPDSAASSDPNPLSQRLHILRYAYGLNQAIFMDLGQLNELWQLCSSSGDREEAMIFIANASFPGPTNGNAPAPTQPQPHNAPPAEDLLSAAFTEEVCANTFLSLFCAASVSYQSLGEGAYRSLQAIFNKLRQSPTHGRESTVAGLDTLWRICLETGSNVVATQAMNDLLAVYISYSSDSSRWTSNQAPKDAFNESPFESFGKRVFDCLTHVKNGLENKDQTAEMAAERCLRILNAAIAQGVPGGSVATSTISRLTTLSPADGIQQAIKFLPHGMRGQACYRKVGIMAKSTNSAQQGVAATPTVTNPGAVRVQPTNRGPSTYRFTLDVHPLETLQSIKAKVASYCNCPETSVKAITINGRAGNQTSEGESAQQVGLNLVAETAVADEIGIVQGCEIVFALTEPPVPQAGPNPASPMVRDLSQDLSDIFYKTESEFPDKLLQMLLQVLEALPWREQDAMVDVSSVSVDPHKLVWDLILAMPTNAAIDEQVQKAAQSQGASASPRDDAMEIDVPSLDRWSKVLDLNNFHRSVYVLLAIDALLQPAVETLSCLPVEQRRVLERETMNRAASFRRDFIESGGFDGVVKFFSSPEQHLEMSQGMKRMGNAVALRILKCCLFGGQAPLVDPTSQPGQLDDAGSKLLQSLSDAEGLLNSLAAMVVGDSGISTSTISDVLKFLRLLFRSTSTAQSFVSLSNGMAERFIITLLLWEGTSDSARQASSITAATKVRKNAHDLILSTPILSEHAMPWLIQAIDRVDVSSEVTAEFFDVLQKLVSVADSSRPGESSAMATAVCKKLASCPRPSAEASLVDLTTGVLCGCLTLMRALIEKGEGDSFKSGIDLLLNGVDIKRWSDLVSSPNSGMFSTASNAQAKTEVSDKTLVDMMGVIFDVFLSPGASSSEMPICSDKESRQRGFDVVSSAARSCLGSSGYLALVARINGLVSSSAPFLKHNWGQVAGGGDLQPRGSKVSSKYSGLRNQGCTCYMNSVLQQLFMMPELRKSMCSAPLPASIRSSGGAVATKGVDLVGKRLSIQWENGISYDAIVEAFDKDSAMHTIRYCAMPVAIVGGSNHHQIHAEDIDALPPLLPEEFVLTEGRPGKETGVFEIVNTMSNGPDSSAAAGSTENPSGSIEESEDEAASRHLMEEFQRTLIHLEEGSRGRCFDPKGLVEASTILKMEFDVWQQNDASEFATKLLDKLETSLKRWAPDNFRYMDHTFGVKQTKQKICKECGLKTNREEKLLNIDCQIRGKSDIHEALAAVTETEIMDGSNKVFCDRCNRKTDTILRTAISTLPNMLVLSLKRFDLDFTTFETVKLNSRCSFGQSLNMKRYTLDGIEAVEQAGAEEKQDGPAPMDIGDADPLSHLPDDDYEYRLAGVLIHAGVAQGGHYYSFIKDRNPGSDEKWYRFDDEDVTPFDPALIETECFGGKVKKETKWPNGQVHTVESEQFANALMLFYEKVKPTDPPPPTEKEQAETTKNIPQGLPMSSGYDVFEPDVEKSNSTHKWQTFLFDPEFQGFLKGLLGMCRMSATATDQMADTGVRGKGLPADTWRGSVVQMLLTFFFDIFLYSSERPALDEWVLMLEETMQAHQNSARIFVTKLASKTREVSGNWLATYLTDCPDRAARIAAVRVFASAIKSCMALPDEQEKIGGWAEAWKEQVASLGDVIRQPIPCSLEVNWKTFEEPQSSTMSTIGVILSATNALLDSSPRNWRFSPELHLFVRNLANMDSEFGGDKVRDAMIACLVPARLCCLVAKDRSPSLLRVAFPGSSVGNDVAESQMRPEQNPAPQMMSITGNAVMNPPDMNYRGGGSPIDFLHLFEALGCLLGVRGVVHAPLVTDVDENARGRSTANLTEPAIAALNIVFKESCAPGATGMGQREIEVYLRRCGVDSVPPQKIMDIMAKYPSPSDSNGTVRSDSLSWEGFLAYYRDTIQSNEIRVRLDLHTFGFRPDLSRRSAESRISVVQGQDEPRKTAESVAIDSAELLRNKIPNLGKLADMGLFTFIMHANAYGASEPLAENILAAAAFGRDTSSLIIDTLRNIYSAPTGWVGNETVSAAIMMLRVLASIPDSKQTERIASIMDCQERPAERAETGVGLLVASRAFYNARARHQYPNEMNYSFDRYVSVLRDLLGLDSIYAWMNENRNQWHWMEHELLMTHQQTQPHQNRGDYNGRRGDAAVGMALEHHHHSDTDDNLQHMHESEDDDDEGSYDEMEMQDAPNSILVENAGNPAVCGVYSKHGSWERAYKYSKQGEYDGRVVQFSIFQCNVSNNTKHWYISVVPTHGNPGTSSDIDFYSAPVTDSCRYLPPQEGWTKSNEGKDPSPLLVFRSDGVQPSSVEYMRSNHGGNIA